MLALTSLLAALADADRAGEPGAAAATAAGTFRAARIVRGVYLRAAWMPLAARALRCEKRSVAWAGADAGAAAGGPVIPAV